MNTAPSQSINKETDGHASCTHESVSINTDGRSAYEWDTKYPPEALKMITTDTIYVSVIFFIALCSSFICVTNLLTTCLNWHPSVCTYLQYALPGLLGGITFGMKYLYRSVARGYWHRDRRIWRILSPWIALSVSFAMGIMVEGSFISSSTNQTAVYTEAKRVGVGFLSGYFADQAVGKMCDLADVLFGKRNG